MKINNLYKFERSFLKLGVPNNDKKNFHFVNSKFIFIFIFFLKINLKNILIFHFIKI